MEITSLDMKVEDGFPSEFLVQGLGLWGGIGWKYKIKNRKLSHTNGTKIYSYGIRKKLSKK